MVGIAYSGEHVIQTCVDRYPKICGTRDRDPAIEECLVNLGLKFRDLFPRSLATFVFPFDVKI